MLSQFRRTALLAFLGNPTVPSFRGVLILLAVLRFVLSFASFLSVPLFTTFALENLHLAYSDTTTLYMVHTLVGFAVAFMASSALDHLPVLPIIMAAALLGSLVRVVLATGLPLALLWQVILLCAVLAVNDAFFRGPLQLALKRVVVVEYADEGEAGIQRRLASFVALFYALLNLGQVAASLVIGHWRLVLPATVANDRAILLSAGMLGVVFLLVAGVRRLSAQADRPTPNVRQTAVAMTFASRTFWRFFAIMVLMTGVMSMFPHFELTVTKQLLVAYGEHAPFAYLQAINPAVVVTFSALKAFPAVASRLEMATYDTFVVGTALSALGILGTAVVLFFFPGGSLAVTLAMGLLVFSVGEVLWSVRLTAAALSEAPEGFEAVYLACTGLPHVLVAIVSPLLSRALIGAFCDPVQCHAVYIWATLGLVAATSPVGLLVGRRWLESPRQ